METKNKNFFLCCMCAFCVLIHRYVITKLIERLLKSFHPFGHVLFLGAGAGGGGGGVVFLGRMGQQMLLQMCLLREELEAEGTLIRTLAHVDLLVTQKIGLSAEELVAFAAIESRSVAFLTLASASSSSSSSGFRRLGFFASLAGIHVGSRRRGRHFRRSGEGFLLMVMLLLLLLLMRWLRLNLLVLELLLLRLLMMLLLLLLLNVNGFRFLAALR